MGDPLHLGPHLVLQLHALPASPTLQGRHSPTLRLARRLPATWLPLCMAPRCPRAASRPPSSSSPFLQPDGCPDLCNGNGRCTLGQNSWQCVCQPGWRGPGCSVAMETSCADNMDNEGGERAPSNPQPLKDRASPLSGRQEPVFLKGLSHAVGKCCPNIASEAGVASRGRRGLLETWARGTGVGCSFGFSSGWALALPSGDPSCRTPGAGSYKHIPAAAANTELS